MSEEIRLQNRQNPAGRSVYFSGFDGVRALAAFTVILHHVEMQKHDLRLPGFLGPGLVECMGDMGVEIFFVLSGFLISYLLLAEDQASGNISLGGFYLRRVLRILPLYFLIVFAALTFLPSLVSSLGGMTGAYVDYWVTVRDRNFWGITALLVAMLPNVSLPIFGPAIFAGQTWSIGVEEQFYLIWPGLLKLGGRRKWIPMAAALAVKVAIPMGLIFTMGAWPETQTRGMRLALNLLSQFRLEAMAIGGLGAYLYFEKQDFVSRYLVNRFTRMIAAPGIVALLLAGTSLPYYFVTVPLLATFFLISLPGNPYPVLNLDFKAIRDLGKISYGIYMYHVVFVVITFRVAEALYLFRAESWQLTVFAFLLTSALTVIVARLSYRFFEAPFLALKKRFTTVPSGVVAA